MTARGIAHNLLLNAVTAVAYLATGWLSLQLSEAISILYLPAGVAMTAVLVRGAGVLPGVFLGAVLVQHLALGDIAAPTAWWAYLAPTGATLQAWLTAWMVRHWVGYPSPMDTPRQLVLFLFVCAPLGSLLNAGLSVPMLGAIGILSNTDILYQGYSWWLGDTLGVMLLGPLLLAWFGEPAQAWRPRIRTVTLPVVCALLIAFLTYHQLHARDQQTLAERFEQKSRELANHLQRRLDAQIDTVVAIAKLMELTERISPDQYRAATRPWLQRYPGTQNYGWSPYIPNSERERYEQEQRSLHGPGFAILGRNRTGRTFPAPPAPGHLPITLVEPLEPNRSVVGLDILVLPATAETVRATRESGGVEVTAGFRLVQELGEQRGVVAYLAVFHDPDDADESVATDRLKGVVSAVFRMDDVLRSVLGQLTPDGLSLCLLDLDAPTDNRRLAGPANCDQPSDTTGFQETSWPLTFGNRQWSAHISATTSTADPQRDWVARGAFTLGMLAIVLLSAFLLTITGNNHRIQCLVEQRTRELAHSNASLLHMAHYDPLTGLANRTEWMAQATVMLKDAQRHGDTLAVMFLDIDHFKHINDSLGHGQGDRLLQIMSRRIANSLRQRDIPARLGGDEFVILLPRVAGRVGATVVAGKLVQSLATPIRLAEQDVAVSVSIGVACFPDDGDDVETLLRHADTAMYAVKATGRNGWRCFAAEMNEQLSRRMMITNGLRQALGCFRK